MTYGVLRVIRTGWKLLAIAGAAILLAGFVAQFREVQHFGWAWTASSYTAPVARLVHGYLPTTFRGFDGALLVALAALWAAYVIVDRGLQSVEGATRSRAAAARLRPAQGPERAQAPAAIPRGGPTPANPSYRSEALLVIDLVKSSDLVSRFGNSFFFNLKQRMEQLVTPVAARHSVTYSENTGDGFLFCFPSVAHAAGAAKEIFQTLPLLNQNLPEGAEAALRAAVNFGEVITGRSDGNRTGSAVHKTFRLQGVGPANVTEAEGGVPRDQVPVKNCVFISEEATAGVAKLPEFRYRFLGLTELKGLPGLHRVYQLEWQ